MKISHKKIFKHGMIIILKKEHNVKYKKKEAFTVFLGVNSLNGEFFSFSSKK